MKDAFKKFREEAEERFSAWLSIESAPKDGSLVLCWKRDTGPILLRWKTNKRIEIAHLAKEMMDFSASYFGNPAENDDYELARDGPTHWAYFPSPPGGIGDMKRLTAGEICGKLSELPQDSIVSIQGDWTNSHIREIYIESTSSGQLVAVLVHS